MTDRWYIYGSGGLGAETMDILVHAMTAGCLPKFELGYVNDFASGESVGGIPVCRLEECVPGSNVTLAVGEPADRARLLERVDATELNLSSIISPTAVISPSAEIAAGVIIAPLCSVQANAKIGRNVAVNTMAIIGHDVSVAAGAVISSMVNLGGAVRVGPESYVGMGALVKEGLTLGASSIIGMGSVVYNDVPDGVIALGNPARVARRNEADNKVFKKN